MSHRWVLGAGAAIVALVTATAPAAAQSIGFAIPAQAAATGIPAFARQAKLQILVSSAATRSVRTGAVAGQLTPRAGLERLLRGTGLRIVSWEGSVVTLAAAAPADDLQDTAGASAPEAEPVEVVVTGFREAQASATQLKRQSNTIRDSIVADDIAAFPDLNLAESLQRLPGVSITREAGEGRRINLRGMSPDFTRVQLNGMEVLGNTDSPMDSRYQNRRDRAFDFNIFASELFSRVDVTKSYEAALDEGGLAGTVQLYTAHPFDYKGTEIATSTQLGTGTNTKDLQGRFVGLLSKNWNDSFGALVSVAYTRRNSEEQGYNVYRWGTVRASDWSQFDLSGLPAETQADLTSGDIFYAPRGNRYSSWNSEQERLGITASLQWQPSPALKFTLDGLYGEFNSDRREVHIATRGNVASEIAPTGAGDYYLDDNGTRVNLGPSRINDIRVNEYNEVVYMDVSNTNVSTETRIQQADNQFYQLVLNGEWNPSDRLSVTALAGHEHSSYDKPISDKFYMESYGGIITDQSGDWRHPSNSYDFDVTDPANFRAHQFDLREDYQSADLWTGKLDLAYRLADRDKLRAGVTYRRFSKTGYNKQRNNVLANEFRDGLVDDDVTPYAVVYKDFPALSWVTADVGKAFDYYGLDRNALMPSARAGEWTVTEDTYAAYLQYDFDRQLGGARVRGNAGVRYYRTDQLSNGFLSGAPAQYDVSYDGLLPSANLVVEVTDQLQFRAAYSRNINRVDLSSLALNGTAVQNGSQLTVTAGNPALRPFLADNFDLGLEYYLSKNTAFGATLFYKRIDGFPGTEVVFDVPFASTGLPLNLIPGVTLTPESNVASYSRPINLRSFNLKGLELFAQTDFFFLPAPFDKFGVVGNLTLADAEVDYATAAESDVGTAYLAPLTGLSKVTANATLYYETRGWGARVSANYRSSWRDRTRPQFDRNAIMDYGDGWDPTIYVDFAGFINVTPKLKLTLDVINLTGEKEFQWAQRERKVLLNQLSAGSTFLAGVSYRF